MTSIVFLDAGSVVFTRELLADLYGYADLGPVRIVLHDIDPERLATAEAVAHRIADQLRVPSPRIVATADRRAQAEGARPVPLGLLDHPRPL